jgi:hypothetical protein
VLLTNLLLRSRQLYRQAFSSEGTVEGPLPQPARLFRVKPPHISGLRHLGESGQRRKSGVCAASAARSAG